jgi:hypothetical protein
MNIEEITIHTGQQDDYDMNRDSSRIWAWGTQILSRDRVGRPWWIGVRPKNIRKMNISSSTASFIQVAVDQK